MTKKLITSIAIVLMMTGGLASCESTSDDIERHNLISYNLLKMGAADPKLLIGEWVPIRFSYTVNGSRISNVATISEGRLIIPAAPTPIENKAADRWELRHVNSTWFVCSLSGNLINLEQKGSTFINVPNGHEEVQMVSALRNAHSFVVKDNELFIYFIGTRNRNLLIFKKQQNYEYN